MSEGPVRPRFFYGYTIAALGFLIQAIFWGTYRSFGLFFNPLISEFGWTRAEVAGAASMGWLIVGLLNFPSGALVDKAGPRLTLTIGGFCFGVGFLLMSGVNSLWQVYLFYIIMAVGMSAADVVPLSTIARWFARRRGTITGFAKVGTGIGMMSTPLFAGYLIESQGWRTAYAVLGGIAIVALIVIAQFIRRDPSKMGLKAYGADDSLSAEKRPEDGTTLRKALRVRQFRTLCAVYFLITTISEVVMVHTVPHAVDLSISYAGAAGILSIIGATSIAARAIIGVTVDRLGSKKALLLCFIPLLAALVWLQFADSLWMLYVFAILYGLSHGGFFTLIAPVVAQLFGTVSHGALFGVVMAGNGVGGAIGPVLTGRAFDVLGSYRLPFLILIGMALAAVLLVASLTRTPYQIEAERHAALTSTSRT
ncbi:MAG: MFS transporter [Dehalococcoidia bacterium]|nr:MAG: MFS transporter [Dehalococcoidia bacterium]